MFIRTFALFILASAFSLVRAANVGQATFYQPGEGACGHYNTDADMIVAVAAQFFDTFPGASANPNEYDITSRVLLSTVTDKVIYSNPVCNTQISVTYQGKSVSATIVDRCAGCAGEFDLDMSPAVFDQLADPSVGRLSGVSWTTL